MKAGIAILLFFTGITGFSQTYFLEEFDYENFEILDSLFQNKVKGQIWSTHHAVREVDITEDGVIAEDELFKRTSIVSDPFDADNKIIRFELNKVDPFFYAKYSCDNSRSNNVKEDRIVSRRYNVEKDLYCSDCSDSPLGRKLYEYKTHMTRNEIAIYGSRRKLYKTNRDHWFGMNMLIDKEYELDSVANGESVAQFHIKGSKVINPPVAILIVQGRFKLAIIKNNDGVSEKLDLGPVVKDEWISWKCHLVLSKREKKGLIEIWRNNEKVATFQGKNIFKNYKMYLKLGIYKWGWWDCTRPISRTRRKVISFDKIWADSQDRSVN